MKWIIGEYELPFHAKMKSSRPLMRSTGLKLLASLSFRGIARHNIGSFCVSATINLLWVPQAVSKEWRKGMTIKILKKDIFLDWLEGYLSWLDFVFASYILPTILFLVLLSSDCSTRNFSLGWYVGTLYVHIELLPSILESSQSFLYRAM